MTDRQTLRVAYRVWSPRAKRFFYWIMGIDTIAESNKKFLTRIAAFWAGV